MKRNQYELFCTEAPSDQRQKATWKLPINSHRTLILLVAIQMETKIGSVTYQDIGAQLVIAWGTGRISAC